MPPEARGILIGGWPYQSQSTTKTTCDGFELERQKEKKQQKTKKKIRQQKHSDDDDEEEDEDVRNE